MRGIRTTGPPTAVVLGALLIGTAAAPPAGAAPPHAATAAGAGSGSGSFVSLKATARNTDGGTVEQTILHAYRLAP
ncbi:hypothetical protein [Streptomyces sp. NPDC088246]|uniref:hypothetical protein n=1 Tax=Streptomyces sp. NPDC088246 TaxID=3365842 RepID=UPI0038236479